jgi:hypothetical protein
LLGESKRIFPAGANDSSAGTGIYSVTGRLRGRGSSRQWAFLLLLWLDRRSRSRRADLQTLALFDLDNRDYGTSTETTRRYGLRHARADLTSQGPLVLSFQGARGESTWHAHEGGEGLGVSAFALHAVAVDAAHRVMKLDLEVDAGKTAVPLGGDHPHHTTTSTSPRRGHGSFQSGVRFSGSLAWGEEREDVDGDGGSISHRSESGIFRTLRRSRGNRHSHEWLQIQLTDGTEISAWRHFDRGRANRVIPPCVATAIGPNGEVTSATEFHLERVSFLRDPRVGAPADSREPARYFADRSHLSVPAWRLDLISEPIVAAPAHELPIPYWSGPIGVTGTLGGVPVSGFGFDERTHALVRDFELVEVLRGSLRHLPTAALTAGDLDAAALADLAWQADGFIADGDPQGAIRHLNSTVRPAVDVLAEPHRNHVLAIVDDAADALLRWWVRP